MCEKAQERALSHLACFHRTNFVPDTRPRYDLCPTNSNYTECITGIRTLGNALTDQSGPLIPVDALTAKVRPLQALDPILSSLVMQGRRVFWTWP
jgi:hypothetical protein